MIVVVEPGPDKQFDNALHASGPPVALQSNSLAVANLIKVTWKCGFTLIISLAS